MKIFKYQLWHLLILTGLLAGVHLWIERDSSFLEGELFGWSTRVWFWLTLLVPILHQVYVVVLWRSELFYQSLSRAFGDNGFRLFKAGFAILILSRVLTMVLLAISNRYTLGANPVYVYALTGIFLIPAAYLFYSVKRYFGFDRAFGIDHFKPDEFKSESFVKEGIFKYTSNAMYIYGFLILWIPGLLLQSKAALLAALFNHVYIWVHYYFTELPDIRVIYAEGEKPEQSSKSSS